MKKTRVTALWIGIILLLPGPTGSRGASPPDIPEFVKGMDPMEGFFTLYWDSKEGKIWIEIGTIGEEFLYVNSLATGVGSNPLGLDRSQLGQTRVVHFQKVGPKILLVQNNLRYRALTGSETERRAVDESFAQSILWGAEIAAESGGRMLVDTTSFLYRDAHDVTGRLRSAGQGSYTLDKDRSAVYLDRTRSFPENCEMEVTLTFTASTAGALVAEVAPSPQAVTVRQHHSFIQLPDPDYSPREFDPRMASFAVSFHDYAARLDQPLTKRYLARHRVQKKDPSMSPSEAVEPLVYYVDPGAPEPIRSALLEGASWWNQAFEAAGFRDAFQVEILPDGVDPLDVRYNVIQWVHRSTRGWSYGSSVTDPRTGEILKGHVQLGSLRVRQDRMLIEGLQPLFPDIDSASCSYSSAPEISYLAASDAGTGAVEVALARIRQLAAHEVGHTLGFTHNFAASTYADRASVMDYPAPRVQITPEGTLDLSDAYAVGIGEWDKLAVRYAYSDFGEGADSSRLLGAIIDEAIDRNMLFLSDADARSLGSAHPLANLWDNGSEPIAALENTLEVRRIALDSFGPDNLPPGQPMSELENVLVPVYLHHRYQVAATAKMIGGAYYSYKVRDDSLPPLTIVPADQQRKALEVVLGTLEPGRLTIDPALVKSLHPAAFGYTDSGERFPTQAAPLFDPSAAAATAADLTLSALLHHHRAGRLAGFHALDAAYPGLDEVLESILRRTWKAPTPASDWEAATSRVVEWVTLDHLLGLANQPNAGADVRSIAGAKLREFKLYLEGLEDLTALEGAHRDHAVERIDRFLKRPYSSLEAPPRPSSPPGSPIGTTPR